MILGAHVTQRRNEDEIASGLYLYSDAAERAILLLDACEYARTNRKERRQQQHRDLLRDAALAKKFPDGMPYLQALLHITECRSETEAQPIFKMWLREVKLADFTSSPPKPASDEDATQYIEGLKANNFPVFRTGKGVPPTYVLDEERAHFRLWKQASYIPETRRASAKKRARK